VFLSLFRNKKNECSLFLDEVVAFATAVQKNEGEDASN